MTPCIYPNPTHFPDKLLAILDGTSSLRVFHEPEEVRKDEDLERLEWFEEYAWRETKRKRGFLSWQENYLSKNPVALKRKVERDKAEASRRHEEARRKFLEVHILSEMFNRFYIHDTYRNVYFSKEQEALARAETESKMANRPVSKTVQWQQKEQKRAERIILRKKGLVPAELEEKRKPMVILTEQRQAINEKTQELVDRSDAILEDYLAKDIPDVKLNADSNRDEIIDELDVDIPKISRNQREEEYEKLKTELLIKLERNLINHALIGKKP